ncbi:hypothetical protein ANO11243_029280 [Dothideomycetidae sp. 11243]|nr:hypothetical protein ANO11243_029280 [fungal sp. No.11243]
MEFQYLNFPSSESLPKLSNDRKVTLKTKAKTDVWRKPPAVDDFNAPFMYKSLPVSHFKSARVSASGAWKTLYDQGGLMVVLPHTKSRPTEQKRWVKTGIEFYHGRPMMSVVAADLWADWSLLPLSPEGEREGKMTVVVEREQEERSWNSVLRVSLVGPSGTIPIREVTWAFHDLDESQEMWVGMAVAKPTKGEDEELAVDFEGFDIEFRD